MSRRWLAWVGVVSLGFSGCFKHPMQICTDARITTTGPSMVVTDTLPRRNTEPLAEMTVAGNRTNHRCTKVALIDVDGLLVNANLTGPYSSGENPLDLLREKLDAAAADPHVCAVVLRIDTPGGGVTASDMMWHEVQRFRARTGRPVVAYLLDLATGGGYYLATAADVIYIHPTTVTGGVGVILNLYNLQDTMAQFNVLGQPIKAGEHIDMGSAIRPLPPEQEKMLQAMADEFHQRFVKLVTQRRPGVRADDPTNFDGRVFTATQAQTRGLVDQVGYLEDAIQAAQTQAGQGEARVVMFHRPNDPARAPYAITPNGPPVGRWLPLSVPGLDRSRLPTFLYLWGVEPTVERTGGQ